MNNSNIGQNNNNIMKIIKIILVIWLIFVITFSLVRIFSNSKSSEQKYSELQNKLCTAAKTYVKNNASVLDTTKPGEFAMIKFKTLSDANLIEKKIENPNYNGGIFKQSTVDKYYSMDNSILVIVGNDGNLTCELVDKVGTISSKSSSNKIEVSPENVNGVTLDNGNTKISNGEACSTSELYPGTILSLTAIITPKDATDKTVIWTSSNSNIVTVVGQTDLNRSTMETIEKGLIIVRAEGTATVTAIVDDKTTNCTLTISKQVIQCEAGTYLAKGESTCSICPMGSYCEGGSYTIDLTSDTGKTSCEEGYTSNVGSSECTKKEVTVTYHNNDGSEKTQIEKYAYLGKNDDVGVNQIKNITVTRSGYTFLGWSKDSKATKATYYENYKLDNDWINENYPNIDLYAVWQKNSENTTSNVICKAGTYLAKGESTCSTCPIGSYCEGGSYTIKPTSDIGKTICPNGYKSEKSATSISECYMNVDANQYVKNSNDSSSTSCNKGYSSKEHIVYYGKTSSCTVVELIPQSYELKGVVESSTDSCKNTEEAGYGCLISNSTKDIVLTHNTKLLQNVIDAAASKASSTKIYTVNLPSGTYYFTRGGSKEDLDYVIWLRDNINLIGKGNDDTKANYTKLKTYGTSTKNFIPYGLTMLQHTDKDGKDILKNVRFEKFIIDGNDTRGLEYKGGGGKGIFIAPCDNCHWNTVTIKNTDATGFGMDALKNVTIKNCVAINCGKNADITKHNGASGFGIGTQQFNDESVYIENCIAKDNKKYGFFFESQNRWGGNTVEQYPATTSYGYVVRNCSASGNLDNYGGLRGSDVILINNTSTNPRSYHVFFSDDSRNTYVINMKINGKGFTDINSSHFAYNEIMWAQAMGINFGYNENKLISTESIYERFTSNIKFDDFAEITRVEAVLSIWRMMNRPGPYIALANGNVAKKYTSYANINTGFKDVSNAALSAQAILWAKQTGVTTGKTPTTFNPNDKITKGQFIVMLYRLAGKPTSSGNTEMEQAISWAKANKIVITDDPTNEPLPRVRAIIMLYRYYQKYVNNTDYKNFKTYQNYVK